MTNMCAAKKGNDLRETQMTLWRNEEGSIGLTKPTVGDLRIKPWYVTRIL